MRQYNHIYTSEAELETFIARVQQEENISATLVQIFSSDDETTLQGILHDMHTALPDAVIVGASSAGGIVTGHIVEESTVISISLFQKSRLHTYCAKESDSYALGVKLSKELFDADTKCVISFLDGLCHNGEEYLEGLNACNYNNAIIAGGMAADGLRFEKTYTICGDQYFSGGAVAVALRGEDLEIISDYNLGWRAVGPTFTITKSEGPRVYEIDNRPIKDVYAEVLGSFAVENMPASTIEFPLILEENNILIARSMLSVNEDGSILYGGNLDEGSKVRFGLGSRTLVNQYDPKESLKESTLLQGCFIYSCVARKMFLDKELEKTFLMLEKRAPTSGFFTYGEFFFTANNRTQLLNITTTLLFISEKGTQGVGNDLTKGDHFEQISKTDSVLFHLIDYVTTELKRQDRIFRSAKFKLDEFLKALDSVVIISRTDTNRRITYVNERFCEISGYTKEELIGAPHSIVRDPNVPEKLFEEMWKVIEKGRIWKGEFSNRAKDGTIYYVKCSIIPIHDENNNIIEYMAIREDVTSLVESRKKAEAAEAAQAMFLANMSHEIRTPMNAILGFTELLEQTSLDDTQKEYLKTITKSTQILLGIVNDILDSSKIINKKIELEAINFDPKEEFTAIFSLLKKAAQEKSIRYSLELDARLGSCMKSDVMRLRQVLMNLLSNAIKFTPKFGLVKLQVTLLESQEDRQRVLISVQDSGIGIAKEKQKEIFKPFAQADASTTRKFGGTGLGLSISADLLRAFETELKVESREGEGSRFFFELEFPLCQEDTKLLTNSHVAAEVNGDKQNNDELYLHILVAEDYDVNRSLIEFIFQKYKNITLDFAVNGEDAIEKIERNSYDLVLMDINMPVLNGADATRYIRQELGIEQLPIVALSANALEGDREKFLAYGMDDYLTKPIDTKALEKVLKKYSKSQKERSVYHVESIVHGVKEKVGLGEETTLHLLGTFLESLKELVPQLEEAISLKEATRAYEIAHKLKGAASALYIEDIATVMQAIEAAAQQGELPSKEDDLKEIYNSIEILEEGLGNIIKV